MLKNLPIKLAAIGLIIFLALLFVFIQTGINSIYLPLIVISSLALGGIITYLALIDRVDRLSNLSSTDTTTGLYHSQVINKLLTYDLERSRRYKRDLSIVLIDIDGLSEINDLYGLKKGSAVLKKMGDIINLGIEYIDQEKKEFHGIRNSDIAFKYEGENKLLIIMPETDAKGAYIAVERLREAVMFTPFELVGEDKNVWVSLSASVVSFNDKTDVTDSLLQRAELLLQKAQVTKNHVVIENPLHNGLAVLSHEEDSASIRETQLS